VDFIDEEDIVLFKVGQDGGQVSGAFDGGAGGGLDINACLGGDDMGQAGLAQAGRPVEQDMVQGFSPSSGSRNGDFQVFLRLVLPDEVGQAAGSETGIERCVLGAGLA
jgi:hypothetical protein